MKLFLMAVAGLALATMAVVVSSRVPAAPARSVGSTLLRLPRATPAGQTTIFGHIKSLVREGGRWKMRFDPALMLTGAAAEQAAFEDTGSRDVPNDSYTLEESHRLVTYVVSSSAPVTVLTKGLGTATIPVAELSQILKGKNPQHRPLFDRANGLGYWLRVGDKYPSPVLSLEQQYHP
jgi:hypothetical protein